MILRFLHSLVTNKQNTENTNEIKCQHTPQEQRKKKKNP